MFLNAKARALLTLRAMFTRQNGSNPIVTCDYVIEKIEAVMDTENPEQLLDQKNRATFHKLAEEVR